MSHGPILIFDKSTLQSLNPDEAVWLDNFFLTNITPLFFIETLADLEKEVRSGRSPEQVVGSLAYKTPDMGSRPNVRHATLLAAELLGAETIDMRYGRPIVSGGKPVMLEGKTGIVFQQAPEEEALQRWQNGEFLELERLIAKSWRTALSRMNHEETYATVQQLFTRTQRPRTLHDVKSLTDAFIDRLDQDGILRSGLGLLGFSEDLHEQILVRWQLAGKPSVRDFVPYFRYVLSVDMFFYIGMAADLISRVRLSNRVDFAYLYYLPFCMVFASNDTLHSRVVPLFLRPDQTFVAGAALKEDLGKLDSYFSRLPEEIKNQGISRFATYPPTDSSFLVTRLWDKYLPEWRKKTQAQKPINKDAENAILEKLKRIKREGVPVNPPPGFTSDDANHLMITRHVYARKGKWRRFPPEVEQSHRSGTGNQEM